MFKKKLKVAILGAGSFGTAMAFIASHNNYIIYLYCRDENQKDHINKYHTNPKRLTEFTLPNSIIASTDLNETIANASIIIHAIPVQTYT